MVGIDVTEAAAIGKRLSKRWPRCVIRRDPASGNHEVRTAAGELLAAHQDLGDCLRAADALAKEGR